MRTKSAVPPHRAKKRLFKRVEGYVGGRRKLLRTAKESIIRSGVYAHRDRRRRKREFRRLWIIRINAATRVNGMSYSQFLHGLKKADVQVDRKVLASIAMSDAASFGKLVEFAKAQLN